MMLCRFGQPIKVNWAYASGQREDTTGVLFLFSRLYLALLVWLLIRNCMMFSMDFSYYLFSMLLVPGHYNVFVGDLSPEVTDATLFAAFCVYPSCS